MGAFNEWVKGSCLEPPRNRQVVTVALNILYGAAVLQRLQALRSQGIAVPATWGGWTPLERAAMEERLKEMRVSA
jgi:trans-AT polyketide synthase, acyltransferase and oxidoreductase domains